jgi:hypothetical protein
VLGVQPVKKIVVLIGVLRIAVARHNPCSTLAHFVNKSRKLNLLFITKSVIRIRREVCRSTQRTIRRVKVGKGIFVNKPPCKRVITTDYLNIA